MRHLEEATKGKLSDDDDRRNKDGARMGELWKTPTPKKEKSEKFNFSDFSFFGGMPKFIYY